MTSPTPRGAPRLERPPSDRFAPDQPPPAAPAAGSVARAVLAAEGTALAGAALAVVLGGVLALSAGLLVLWASIGSLIGQVVRRTGGAALPRSARAGLATSSAVAGVAVGQLGLWLYADLEGGALPLIEYLAQTYGVLVPLQALVAAGFAWWSGR